MVAHRRLRDTDRGRQRRERLTPIPGEEAQQLAVEVADHPVIMSNGTAADGCIDQPSFAESRLDEGDVVLGNHPAG